MRAYEFDKSILNERINNEIDTWLNTYNIKCDDIFAPAYKVKIKNIDDTTIDVSIVYIDKFTETGENCPWDHHFNKLYTRSRYFFKEYETAKKFMAHFRLVFSNDYIVNINT